MEWKHNLSRAQQTINNSNRGKQELITLATEITDEMISCQRRWRILAANYRTGCLVVLATEHYSLMKPKRVIISIMKKIGVNRFGF